jgi:hypothetical protein
MCGEYISKDVYEKANATDWFDKVLKEIRGGNIGEPQKHVEFEPLPEAAPVEEPAAPVREAEPVPA